MYYIVLTIIFSIQFINGSDGSYYWRDYYGKIPEDAFRAGKDILNENTYIGQGFSIDVKDSGIFPATISKGKEFFVPFYGAKKAGKFVQILCTDDPEGFEWVLSNATHHHLIQTDNEHVRGGIEADKWLNIGRVKYQGNTVFGKIHSGNVGMADMWFVHDEKEIQALSYEVLTYNDIAKKIQLRTLADIII